MTTADHLRTILGIKLKRLREARGLTLSALAARAGLSVSYLAEIELGRKTPKPAKVLALAEALGASYDQLASTSLDGEFRDLRELLGSPALLEFPFERFGLPAAEILQLLSRSPAEVTALLRALNDIARQHNIGLDHFLHAALRSYQELTGNFYPDLEAEAERFVAELDGDPAGAGLGDALRAWVERELGTPVDDRTLTRRPPLRRLRSALTGGARPRLLLNRDLTPSQRAFLLAREAGYRRLGLRARSFTSPPDREDSFDQVLNDFRASYFAGAVVLPRAAVLRDLRRAFRQPRWRPELLTGLLERHDATPETLMYRLSQLAPGEFGLRVHFLKFVDDDGTYRLVKQLNLSELPVPPGHGGAEHYCRRWLTTRLLSELAAWQEAHPRGRPAPAPGVQVSRFVDGEDEYCCVGLAQPMPLRPDVNISLTLGFRVDAAFRKAVRFARDPAIPHAVISTTCERCPLDAAACDDRVAPPTLLRAAETRAAQARALAALDGELAAAAPAAP
jgi:transcriptional regulator with XRE-family HTH domain